MWDYVLCKGTGCENCFKRTTPNYFFFLVTQHTRGREKDERMKEKWKKEENKFDWPTTTHRHLAPMTYHSAHPIPKCLFIKRVPWKVDENRLHAFLVSALRRERPVSHSMFYLRVNRSGTEWNRNTTCSSTFHISSCGQESCGCRHA